MMPLPASYFYNVLQLCKGFFFWQNCITFIVLSDFHNYFDVLHFLDGQAAKLHKDCLWNIERTTNAVICGIQEVRKNLEELQKPRTVIIMVLFLCNSFLPLLEIGMKLTANLRFKKQSAWQFCQLELTSIWGTREF